MRQRELWLALFLASAATLAAAQARAQASGAALGANAARALSDPYAGGHVDAAEPSMDRHPMDWIGVGLKVGAAGVSAGSATIVGYEGTTDARIGLHVSVPINLGGDGLGLVLEPMLETSRVPRPVHEVTGEVIGPEEVSVLGLGGYLGPTFAIHVADPVYLGFGLGVKALYLINDQFDYAIDLYGRVPLSATYYAAPNLALVFELGLGYGFSVFADVPRGEFNPATQMLRIVSDDPRFGTAFAWDASFGVRLP